MTILNDNSISAIKAWGNQQNGNPAAAQALINAAAQSPYLASQFNTLFASGGSLVVGPAGDGTGALGKVATIDPNMVNDYMNRGTDVAQKQLATMFAHEMGHVLSPGGSVAGTARSPEEAKTISRQAEGVALSSELIVAYQLNLGSAGQYSHSDNGQLTAHGAGALSVEFSLLTNLG